MDFVSVNRHSILDNVGWLVGYKVVRLSKPTNQVGSVVSFVGLLRLTTVCHTVKTTSLQS